MSIKVLLCSLSLASALKVEPAAKPNLMKLRGGLSLETTSLVGALYNGGFGVTLVRSEAAL
jgi:hypothetical protein